MLGRKDMWNGPVPWECVVLENRGISLLLNALSYWGTKVLAPYQVPHPRVPVPEREVPQPLAAKTSGDFGWVRAQRAPGVGDFFKGHPHKLTHWVPTLGQQFEECQQLMGGNSCWASGRGLRENVLFQRSASDVHCCLVEPYSVQHMNAEVHHNWVFISLDNTGCPTQVIPWEFPLSKMWSQPNRF